MKIFIPLLFVIVVGCNTNKKHDCECKEEVEEVVLNDLSHIGSDAEFKKNIRSSRDTFSYECLSTTAIEWGHDGIFLPYALLMANKWDYAPAYYDVYDNLFLLFDCEFNDISCFDKKTAIMAISYLIMAYEKSNYDEYYKSRIDKHLQENFILERNGKYFVNEDYINNTLN
jgi:hypothetical protein